jgi:hypothetical protein
MMRPICLIACLTMLCTCTALAQEAYVYDYIPNKGVYAYDASSTGKLTLIKGSPFKTAGQMVGTNGTHFVTSDSTSVYSYAVESNGAIGKLVSDINTQHYSGSDCGTIGYQGAVAGEFAHTGETVYILLSGAPGDNDGACDGIQTYGISKSGTFTFKGATAFNQEASYFYAGNLPTLTGNGKFGYGFEYNIFDEDVCSPTLNIFAGESGGVLGYQDNLLTPPPAPPSGDSWILTAITDDPSDHIVLALYTTTDVDCNDGPTFGPAQLASYTVNSQGNLTTTNTYENMPKLPGGDYPYLMKLDPTGKILAVAMGTGVAFYHFNGADPITAFSGIIGDSGQIALMAWDTRGHLYAQNSASGRMHVYEVTTKTAKELSGSPTSIPFSAPYSSFVVRTK